HAALERNISTDFFNARGRQAAVTAYEQCQQILRASQSRAKTVTRSREAVGDIMDHSQYQGRRWATRRNLHIDRLASAWLIKRFIDARPRFFFVAEGESVEGSIPFDMFGAELTHHGEDCTFETMINRFALDSDPGLREMAEIVHDIDLKDDKFHRLEAAGLDAVVSGLSELIKDDRKLIQQSSTVFDGLYAMLSVRSKKSVGKADGGGKRIKRRGGKRGKKT
ncbi:MAG TPA: chromate resistance protein ChrB domain-containing protein, partial [Pyrinomonadaceae bacterium]|nr:chromate resistance protein ChrB domain-containing protein [Pyrinomonadaceae bacterium]